MELGNRPGQGPASRSKRSSGGHQGLDQGCNILHIYVIIGRDLCLYLLFPFSVSCLCPFLHLSSLCHSTFFAPPPPFSQTNPLFSDKYYFPAACVHFSFYLYSLSTPSISRPISHRQVISPQP